MPVQHLDLTQRLQSDDPPGSKERCQPEMLRWPVYQIDFLNDRETQRGVDFCSQKMFRSL